MDHMVGALRFAKDVGRTLVLPPWNVFIKGADVSFPSFDTFFNVTAVQLYTKAIPMDTFLKRFGDSHWSPEKRRGYCWNKDGEEPLDYCNIKEGSHSLFSASVLCCFDARLCTHRESVWQLLEQPQD